MFRLSSYIAMASGFKAIYIFMYISLYMHDSYGQYRIKWYNARSLRYIYGLPAFGLVISNDLISLDQKLEDHRCISMISGIASLDLMLGHTFYNRTCLATSTLVHTCIYIWLLSKKCTAWLTIAKLLNVKAWGVASTNAYKPASLMYYCYEIMCINKYRLWDHTQKITWFHILLARNTIFPFLLLPGHQPRLANRRWSCLEVQAQASNLCLAMFWKTAVSPIHDLGWCPINIYKSFF